MIEDLKKLIYPIPKNEIDKTNIEKNIFKLMRTSILEKNYEIQVGPYILNFNPDELKVFYENEFTKVELSNEDFYYETMRPLETKYYCLSNENKETYSLDTPYYIVDNNIVNIAGVFEEHYSLELVSENPNINIMDNLNVPSSFDLVTNDENGLTLAHEIQKEDQRFNPLTLFNNNVKEVYYDEEKALFVNKDTYKNEKYQKYLPDLTKEKEIVTFIFNTMKDFYNKYQ